jgi:hypothetical protein
VSCWTVFIGIEGLAGNTVIAVKLAAALVSVLAVKLVPVPLFVFAVELVPEPPLVFAVVVEDVVDEVSEPAVVLVVVPLLQPASTK